MKIGAAAKFLLIPVCCLLFSGCIKIVNLQDRAIVQGVGVDYEDGQYLITMQIFSSDGSGGQTIIDFSKQNAKVILPGKNHLGSGGGHLHQPGEGLLFGAQPAGHFGRKRPGAAFERIPFLFY